MITAKRLSTILIRLSHQASRYLFLFIFVLFLSCVLIKPFCKRIILLNQTYLITYHILFFLVLYVFLNGLLVMAYCCDINLWTLGETCIFAARRHFEYAPHSRLFDKRVVCNVYLYVLDFRSFRSVFVLSPILCFCLRLETISPLFPISRFDMITDCHNVVFV